MNFGWKPGKQNEKDYDFESFSQHLNKFSFATASNADSFEHIIPEYTPLSNQLTLSSCVANATADTLEILMGLVGKVIQISRLFIYWNARLYINETDKDSGSYIKDAFASLAKDGVCPESVWDYNPDNVLKQPSLEAYRQASDNTITSYYKIQSTGQKRLKDIELAIKANHPVVFGTGITDKFCQSYGSDEVWFAPNQDEIIGLHAMVITGIRKINNNLQFYVRNSWGESWGNNGHAWFDASYILHSSTDDLWVATLMPKIL